MGTELYINSKLPSSDYRILYTIKDLSSKREEVLDKKQIENIVLSSIQSGYSETDKDEAFIKDGCSELYHIATISSGGRDNKRMLSLFVPNWFLKELDPNIEIYALGSSNELRNIGMLLEHINDYNILTFSDNMKAIINKLPPKH